MLKHSIFDEIPKTTLANERSVEKKNKSTSLTARLNQEAVTHEYFSEREELFFPIYAQEHKSWADFTKGYQKICAEDIFPKVDEFVKIYIADRQLKSWECQFFEMDTIENSLDSIACAYFI